MENVQTSTAFEMVPGAHVADCRFSFWDEGNSQSTVHSALMLQLDNSW